MLILREICKRISLNPIPTQTIDFSLVNICQKTTSFARTRSGTKNSLKQKRGPFNSSPFSNNPFAKTNASTATPIDRSSPFFSCKLAKYHSGSVYFKCSSRFQNLFSLHACSVSCTSGIRSKLNNQKRNCIATKKGGNTTSPFQPRRFLPQIVSCSEKRRRPEAGVRFECVKPVYRNRALQNGQDACRGVHSACRREVNRHKLDICILRLRQGRIPGIFVCRSKFPGLKVGRGS